MGTKKTKQEENNPVRLDILMLILLGTAILLFVSVIGFCGVFGAGIRYVLFGLFGVGAFAFPILLFFTVSWSMANKGNPLLVRKMIGLAGLYVFGCAFCQIVMIGFDPTYSVFQCFLDSAADHLGGGFFGGCVVQLFGMLIGVIGTYIVLVIGVIIFAIILTQKPLYTKMKNGTKEVYNRAKNSTAERREQKKKKQDVEEVLAERRAQKKAQSRQSEQTANRNRTPEQTAGRNRTTNDDLFDNYINGKTRDGGRTKASAAGTRQEAESAQTPQERPFILPTLDFGTPAGLTEETENPADAAFWESDSPFEQAELADTEPGVGAPGFGNPAVPEPEEAEYTDPAALWAQEESPQFEDVGEITTAGGMREVRKVVPSHKGPAEGADSGKTQKEEERFRLSGEELGLAGKQGGAAAAATGGKPGGSPAEKPYKLPPVSLLNKGHSVNTKEMTAQVRETAMKLQQTLHNFGVEATVVNASCGPTVTRYELQPDQGVKVSKIVALTDDIKLNLAAADIRIEAPIPGKAAVGIEVPNQTNNSVALRELIDTPEFKTSKSKISFAVGKDLAGKPVISDIAKMPHLLIAGSTGSGKSVCMNTLIMSILYKAAPQEVRLMMIDPKVVELSIYNGIPHLLSPVVTDPKKAAGALQWAVAEMTRRYNLFAEFTVRDLTGYNKKAADLAQYATETEPAPEILPQIVIIVDELADLMMAAPGEVEEAIVRLTQLARAAGIHLIIATQRPSVNVITGLIKANMPSRIALSVTSGIDSRVILDMNGAEKLLGKGDMLFYPAGYQKPARVQGAFVSDEEIQKVVAFISRKEVEYDAAIQEAIESASAASSGAAASAGGNDRDVYFADAGRFIIEKDKASIGMLQRVFKIGFNRAARIMDQLCEAGVVGEEEGTKPRKILMTMEQFENYIEET